MSSFLEGSGWDYAFSASRKQYFCDVCNAWLEGGDTQEGLLGHAKAVHDATPIANRYQKEESS